MRITNNKTIYYLFCVYEDLIYETRLLYDLIISLYFKTRYYINMKTNND